jgi:hypothetical protein
MAQSSPEKQPKTKATVQEITQKRQLFCVYLLFSEGELSFYCVDHRNMMQYFKGCWMGL